MDIVRELGCHDEQRHRENNTQTFHASKMAQAFLSEIGRPLNVRSVFGLQTAGLHKLQGYMVTALEGWEANHLANSSQHRRGADRV